MSAFEETLGNGRLGAAILARVARERVTGSLAWIVGDKTRSVVFSGGRPEAVGDTEGRESTSKQHVVAVLRALAIADIGVCRFKDGDRGFTSTLGIDLGVFGAPETYVLDHQGVIRYRHVGVVNERVWKERLEPLITELRRQAGGP